MNKDFIDKLNKKFDYAENEIDETKEKLRDLEKYTGWHVDRIDILEKQIEELKHVNENLIIENQHFQVGFHILYKHIRTPEFLSYLQAFYEIDDRLCIGDLMKIEKEFDKLSGL